MTFMLAGAQPIPYGTGCTPAPTRRICCCAVLLEITKRCNLRCYHCYVAGPTGDELGTERILALLDEFAGEGCISVTLTGGEVGLRDDFLTIARGVKQHRMTLNVLTNGTAFRDEDLDELAALKPASVSVSIYGSTPAGHEKVTGVAGSFARSLATVRRLRERGVRCNIRSVLMRENFDDFTNIASLAGDMGCDYRFDPTVAPRADGDGDVLEHRVSGKELRDFYLHTLFEQSIQGRLVD